MALEGLCGVSPNLGFGRTQDNQEEIENYFFNNSGNISCHTQLALPPLRDVSDFCKS